MTAFLFELHALPFTIALLLMLVIGLLEGVGLLLGAGASSFIDGALPELDTDLDLDLDGELPDASFLTQALGWLHVGRVPILVLVVLLLFFFGSWGLTLQFAALSVWGGLANGILVAMVALALSLPMVRVSGGALARLIPKDETDAVSSESFVGRVAVIGAATAKRSQAAQAKLYDQHGQAHYLLIEPDLDDDVFEPGCEVLVVRRDGARFYAIKNTSSALGI